MHVSRLKLTAAAILLSLALPCQAVTVSGTDVDFTFDDTTLFGTAIAAGNSLIFQPTNFKAESLNGAGVVTASQTLSINIMVTTTGFDIASLAMVEQGDYILTGAGASVAASGRLGVISATNKVCSVIACNDASIFNVDPPFVDTAGFGVEWSGGTRVVLADTAGWGSDTAVQVSFQNNLSATTLNTGEQATIQKKLGAIGLVVNPVPVPAAVWLFGSGLLGLVGIARRRSRH